MLCYIPIITDILEQRGFGSMLLSRLSINFNPNHLFFNAFKARCNISIQMLMLLFLLFTYFLSIMYRDM